MSSRCALFERLTLHTPHLSNKLSIPAFLYGTAWKGDKTTDLVHQALKNGFTAIDTAAQPKHYREDLVGEALRQAIREKIVIRSEVFMQTKFTSVDGQDPKRMPYNADWPITQQVSSSVQSSLKNFDCSAVSEGAAETQSPYLDSVVLHSPLRTLGETMEAWRALESFVPHQIRTLGISNVSIEILKELYENATIKPTVVQNRFYPSTRFDQGLRQFCKEQDIIYQSFWTLTANPRLLQSKPVQNIAARVGVSSEAAMYCCVIGLEDIVILNGTTNSQHMQSDWTALDQVRESISNNPAAWQSDLEHFRALLSQPSRLSP